MKTCLFFSAVLGWVASIFVHLTAITGEDLSETYPGVMMLHAGIFVVWLPVVLYLKRDRDYKQFQQLGMFQRSNPITFFKILLKNAPPYLKVIAIAGVAYAQINFLVPFIESNFEMNTARLFSGHWLAFYGIALGALYPFKKAEIL